MKINFNVGDPNKFGIEVAVDISKSNPWLYGQFGFSIAGRKLDTNGHNNLEDIYASLVRVRDSNSKRESTTLFELPAEGVALWIRGVLYAENTSDLAAISTGLPEDVMRFCLNFHPAFGCNWLFLVCHSTRARLILADNDITTITEVQGCVTEFECLIERAYSFLHQQVSQLHPSIS
jgi:Immunity protein 42